MLKIISSKFSNNFNLTNLKRLAIIPESLSFILLILAMASNIVVSDAFQIGPIEGKMLKDDILSIQIQPAVEKLWVNYSSPKSGGIEVHLYSNKTLGLSNFSLIYFIPRSEGTYDITIEFNSKSSWNCMVGVYTLNYTFYGKRPVMTSLGPFVQLIPPFKVNSKNRTDQITSYRIHIVLSVKKYEERSGMFLSFEFPTPVNTAIFMAISFSLAYVNAFLILDTYFRSRTEEVSRMRLALLCLMILASLFVLYYAYFFMKG